MTDDAVDQDESGEPARTGRGASGRIIAIAIVAAVILAAVVGRAWLDIRATRPLPGTPLAIQTDPPAPAGFVCGSALLPPSRLVVRGTALELVSANGSADLQVVWPSGYAARLDQGRGGVYDSTGYLVAAEGQAILERFFGSPGSDGAFHVCRVARD